MTRARAALVLVCCAIAALLSRPLFAQSGGGPAPQGDPIQCWWRTSAGAIATGEPFDVVLTCAVREDATMRVVADESRLGVEAIQLAPFEVLAGAHPADLRTDRRRFFQYRYTLRVIDPDAIGKDIPLPDVTINYRIETPDNGGTALEGRDRTYILRGLPIRVLSLVPAAADDIRDAGDEDFGRVHALRLRAQTFQLVAVALAALGVVLLIPAVMRARRRAHTGDSLPREQVPLHSILRHVERELRDLHDASRGGWNEALAQRLLAALRVTAAIAIGRPLSQRVHVPGETPSAGRIAVAGGLLGRRLFTVSSPVTSSDIARERSANASSPAQRLDDLQQGLATLTTALYQRQFTGDSAQLEPALNAAMQAAQELRRRHAWWRRIGADQRSGSRRAG